MNTLPLYDETIYKELKTRWERFEIWRGGRMSYPAETVPAEFRVTNEERGYIEVFEFLNDPPVTYFLYIDEEAKLAKTWPGHLLGEVTFGLSYHSNMGDLRVPITVYAINGLTYYGTFYKSAGDYARIRVKKGGRR